VVVVAESMHATPCGHTQQNDADVPPLLTTPLNHQQPCARTRPNNRQQVKAARKLDRRMGEMAAETAAARQEAADRAAQLVKLEGQLSEERRAREGAASTLHAQVGGMIGSAAVLLVGCAVVGRCKGGVFGG